MRGVVALVLAAASCRRRRYKMPLRSVGVMRSKPSGVVTDFNLMFSSSEILPRRESGYEMVHPQEIIAPVSTRFPALHTSAILYSL